MGDEKLIEQYKIIWDTFNRETERFWNRFNVLIGVQIAVSIAILSPILAKDNIIINFMAYGFLLLLSVITTFILNRAIKIYELQINLIKHFEDNNEGFEILSMINCNKDLEINTPYAYKIARVVPDFLIICWAVVLLLEVFEAFQLL